MLTPQGLMLAPTDEARILPDIYETVWSLRLSAALDTGCWSLGFARSAPLCRQISHIGEILPAATSSRYAHPRNPSGPRAPLP